MGSVRTFVALELPWAVGITLAAAIERLAFLGNKVRWVRPEGAHLTLKFLGDVDEARVPGVVAAVQDAASGIPPFTLKTAHLGGFPRLERARVFWLGLQGDVDVVCRLQERVEQVLAPMGFAPERRRFFPHITLGRARRNPVGGAPASGAAVPAVHFPVDRVVVMKSDLQPGGAVYSPLGYGLLES